MREFTVGAGILKDHIDLHRLPGDKGLRVTYHRKGLPRYLVELATSRSGASPMDPTGAYRTAF